MKLGVGAIAAIVLLALPAAAQKPPNVFSWNTGWSADAKGLKHVSGLNCPSAVWKGIGVTAPIGFDSDPVAGTKIDAECQYYEYWDSGTPKETRFVVNLILTPDMSGLAGAWAALKVKEGAPKFEIVKRDTGSYRTVTWPVFVGHRSMIIARDGGDGGRGIVAIVVVPMAWTDAKVWPVIDAMFKANP